jgi:hypothetical protein
MAAMMRHALKEGLRNDTLQAITVGRVWDNMKTAKWEVKRAILDEGESWGYIKSDKERLLLKCKDGNCTFRVWIQLLASGKARLSVFEPHICDPVTHNAFRTAHGKKYVGEHHQRSIASNPSIPTKQLIEDEISFFGRRGLSRKQAWRTREHVKVEISGLLRPQAYAEEEPERAKSPEDEQQYDDLFQDDLGTSGTSRQILDSCKTLANLHIGALSSSQEASANPNCNNNINTTSQSRPTTPPLQRGGRIVNPGIQWIIDLGLEEEAAEAEFLSRIRRQAVRSPSPPPLSPRSKNQKQAERDIKRANKNLQNALKDVASPESVFWRYKFTRRLWRMENGFASDSIYRTTAGLAFCIDRHGRRIKEPLDRVIASNPAFSMGECLSRPRDKKNSQYRGNMHSFKPSP